MEKPNSRTKKELLKKIFDIGLAAAVATAIGTTAVELDKQFNMGYETGASSKSELKLPADNVPVVDSLRAEVNALGYNTGKGDAAVEKLAASMLIIKPLDFQSNPPQLTGFSDASRGGNLEGTLGRQEEQNIRTKKLESAFKNAGISVKSAFTSSDSNSVEILSETAKKYEELGNINIPEEVVSVTLSPEATENDILNAKQIIRDQYSSKFILDFDAIENTYFILEKCQVLAVVAKDPLYAAKN